MGRSLLAERAPCPAKTLRRSRLLAGERSVARAPDRPTDIARPPPVSNAGALCIGSCDRICFAALQGLCGLVEGRPGPTASFAGMLMQAAFEYRAAIPNPK